MEIIITLSNNINKKIWDKSIDSSYNGNVFFTSWYLDIITGGKWLGISDSNLNWLIPIPAHRLLLNFKLKTPGYWPYTSFIYKNPIPLNLNWEEIIYKTPKIRKLLTNNKLYFKFFPSKTIIKQSEKINFELDLPYGLDLLRNHDKYQSYLKKTFSAALYANTQIPARGLIQFISENHPPDKARILNQIVYAATSRGRLVSIGIYNRASRLVALTIGIIFRNRLNIIAHITKKALIELEPEFYRFLTLKKICESYHNMNLTLEMPQYLDFFEDLPFASITKAVHLFRVTVPG